MFNKESDRIVSIFCAPVFCSNFKWHLDWIAAPTPLCLGSDQTMCDISRRFPRHTEYFLRLMNLRKQSGSAIFNPDFHLLVLASWLTAPKASRETMTWVLNSDGMWEHKHLCVLWDYNLPHFFVLVFFTEPGVGLGIGACCLTLENSSPGIYIHSLAPGSVAKMDGRLRLVKTETCWSDFTINQLVNVAGKKFTLRSSPKRKHLSKDIPK